MFSRGGSLTDGKERTTKTAGDHKLGLDQQQEGPQRNQSDEYKDQTGEQDSPVVEPAVNSVWECGSRVCFSDPHALPRNRTPVPTKAFKSCRITLIVCKNTRMMTHDIPSALHL